MNLDFLDYNERVTFEESLWKRALTVSSVEQTEKFLIWFNQLRTPKGCDIKITGFEEGKKIAVIKLVRTLTPGLGLAETKFAVEGRVYPSGEPSDGILFKDLSQSEAAEKIQALREAGAHVVLIKPIEIATMHEVQNYDE